MSTVAAAPQLLHEFFARAARRWPDRTAVDVPPGPFRPARRRTSYAELDRQSDAVAALLSGAVTGECVVAIMLPRTSAHVYAAQLAVLKAGAAYACIEPAFPDERLRDILADARPVRLLTDPAGRSRAIAAGFPAEAILDVVQHQPPARLAHVPAPAWLTPSDLAYVIYTSGTTGRPKGVMIEHRSIANLVASDLDAFRLRPEDRVAQGSSSAYDSSVEETWLAFAAGATVVLMDDDAARLGPDLVGWLQRERVTVFCPPPTLLRAMGVGDPAAELPGIHLLYVGGEALPPDIAERWARGRALVNGYGPTECTVTALRARIAEEQNVTIGRPVPGVHAWVLNEALEVVADGRKGELCLGGIALARGYWNQPELTAARFPLHPVLGRLYRTGDLVHQGEDGAFIYYGRLDAQVKLRGYRVELGAIESALAACTGVRAAACAVQEEGGRQTLVAFVVPTDAASPPPSAALREALRARLPEYMVPARVAPIAALPTSTGGKLDRNALPRLDGANGDDGHDGSAAAAGSGGNGAGRTAPRDAREARVEQAVRTVLRRAEAVSVHDDFFTALGGDSLSAAELITLLREHPSTSSLAVRDVYEARTVAALAARADAAAGPAPLREAGPRARGRPVGATLVQVAWLLQRLIIGSAIAYLTVFYLLPWLAEVMGASRLMLLSPLLLLASLAVYTPLAVAAAVIAKRTLIGRYRPLREDAWSGFYVRNWIVQQAVRSVPWWLFEGTELHNAMLRALGARIGRRVHLHRGVRLVHGGWDLLDIGDDVTVAQDVSLRLMELEDGQIVMAPIRLGDGATLDVHSGVSGDTVLESGAFLTARSSLRRGERIPNGERWDGIPARPAGRAPGPPALPAGTRELSPAAFAALLIAARVAVTAFEILPLAAVAALAAREDSITAQIAFAWLYSTALGWRTLVAWAAFAIVAMPITLTMEALACRLMGRVAPGVVSRWSPAYVRIWLKPGLVDSAGRWLYGTLFWPWWLRLAGMRLGSGCEISGLIDTLPEAVTIGSRTFCADGIYVAGPRVHRGTVTVGPVALGENVFLGNGVVIAPGQRLPDDVLLGVCTVAEQAALRPGSAWFGHPPMELPHREVIAFDPRFTYAPNRLSKAARVLWELARFAVPVVPALALMLWFKLLIAGEDQSWTMFLLLWAPLITAAATTLHTLLIIAIKWTLLGRVKPGIHPLWSSWASRWDLVCVAWNIYASDVVAALDGTLLLAPLLRAVGVTIGRHVLLGPGFAEDLPDPDMLTFEDGATVDCFIQAHTFEDRVLKIDRIRVRRDATVGRNAVLLYGADVGERTRVAPHSVVMKHERLLPGRSYAGFPTRPDDRAAS